MNKAFDQDLKEIEEWLDFMEEDIENVRRVKDFCEEEDLDVEFKVHARAETAEESAGNTGISPEKVAKTLVFKAGDDFIAVIAPGDRRVSEDRLEEYTGEEVRMAYPREVEEATGYIVGGVSPFDLDIQTVMEESLLEKEMIKPAAGSRVVGVEIDPGELKEVTDSDIEDLT